MIKGTKEGLTLFIDDQRSFHQVLKELSNTTIFDNPSPKQHVPITVQLGKRYINDKERNKIKKIIEERSPLLVTSFDSEVILKEEAQQLASEQETKVIQQIVRSGQVVEEIGDVLLIGDVNPGGTIRATGNIYVMGNLLGVAHAGIQGDREAIIVASYMNPSQLRIADYISRAPDYESAGVYMECGFIDHKENRIILNQLQTLLQKRKDLSGFERRMENG